MLLLPCHLPGLRRSLPRTTDPHLTPGGLSSTSSGRFLGAILLRHASESDVTEEIQIERTSADGRGRALSRILTARDTARARTVSPGSPGLTRVHAGGVGGPRRACALAACAVTNSRNRGSPTCRHRETDVFSGVAFPAAGKARSALAFVFRTLRCTTGARPSPATSARRPGAQTPQTLVRPVPPTGPIALGAGGTN